MVFVRFEKRGQKEYAYRITPYWDNVQKKPKQKSEYLGIVIDKEKKIFEKKQKFSKPEKLILDFGDTYLLEQVFKNFNVTKILSNIFIGQTDTLFSLIHYKLCYNGAMVYAKTWFDGNFAKIIYKNADVSSQRISDFLSFLGEEIFQRKFFQEYLQTFSHSNKGIIIDGTSLPNQIHNPLTAWGLSGEEIDKQIRFLLVVDKENTAPLFFRVLPGNIIDVTSLKNTINELAQFGIKDCFIYSDAGFFSEDNIKELYGKEIQFLTRLPATRTIYKDLIRQEAPQIEQIQNGVRYGKRGLFVKQKEIELFGKKVYAYIVQDPKRKGRELDRFIIENLDEKETNKELEYEFLNRGIMILISSFEIQKQEVVSAYYIRQKAEMLFGFSKDDIGILPLRVHNQQRIQGFLFLQFLALIYFIQLKNKLDKEYTVEEILLSMRNLKCKVYDKEILIGELTKEQKQLTEKLEIIMPKTLGI